MCSEILRESKDNHDGATMCHPEQARQMIDDTIPFWPTLVASLLGKSLSPP